MSAKKVGRSGAVECPWNFPGQYADKESGLYSNCFRYYDPCTGRYISPDPVRLLGGLNEYNYNRNPVGWIDPLGLCGDENDGPMELSEFNGKTSGYMVTEDGQVFPVNQRSADEIADFDLHDMPTQQALRHAEGEAVDILNGLDVNSATVVVNHPKGVCNYCSSNLKKRLKKGKTILLTAPNANPPNRRWKKEALVKGEA